MNEPEHSFSLLSTSNSAEENSNDNIFLNFLSRIYGLTTLKDTDPLPLWTFKIFLRIIFILVMIALSPVIILGLVLTFFMAF